MLYDKYKKKLMFGGSELAMAGQLTGSLVEGTSNEYGVKKNAGASGALKGAGSGAGIGMTIGTNPALMAATGGLSAVVAPIAGALIGGITGGSKANREQKAARALEAKAKAREAVMAKEMEASKNKAFWAANPNFREGTLAQSYFKYGGSTQTMDNSGSVEFKGPSHEEGGIDIGSGIEVEGDETMHDGYVFSKRLGFAKDHKKLSKALATMDTKANNPTTAKTAATLRERIEKLKVEQELTKSVIGLPNDLDGSSGRVMQKKAFGGFARPELDEDVLAQESASMEEKLAAERLRNLKSINSTIPGMSKIPTINTTGMVEDSMPTMKSISTFDSKLPSSGMDLTKRTDTTSNGDPAVTDTPTGSGVGGTAKTLLETFTPYLSNLQAAKEIKRLKEPPRPVLATPVQLQGVDYENQVQEVKNQARASRQLSERYLSSGSAIAASAASQGIESAKAISDIQANEANANAQINNQVASMNTQIEQANNSLVNQYNANVVDFANVKASARMENAANATEKLLTQLKDNKSYDVDKMRLEMAVLSDMEGVSARTLEPIIAQIAGGRNNKRYKDLMKVAQEREANKKAARAEDLEYKDLKSKYEAEIAKKSSTATDATTAATTTTEATTPAPTTTKKPATSKTGTKPATTVAKKPVAKPAAVAPGTPTPNLGTVPRTGDMKEVTSIRSALSFGTFLDPAKKAELEKRLKELKSVEDSFTKSKLSIDYNKANAR